MKKKHKKRKKKTEYHTWSRYPKKEYQNSKVLSFSNLLLSLTGVIFLISCSVTAVLCFRQLYYFDIRFLNLKKEVGLDDWIIRRNYDTLIDYNLIIRQKTQLTFPSFPMSQSGRIHFEEVRRIFYGIQYLAAGSGIVFCAGLIRKLIRKDYEVLKLISRLGWAAVILTAAAVLGGWNCFFLMFHRLAFQNDYWLFDPDTDPVINILPDAFFLHCAAAILILIALGSTLCGIWYRKMKH